MVDLHPFMKGRFMQELEESTLILAKSRIDVFLNVGHMQSDSIDGAGFASASVSIMSNILQVKQVCAQFCFCFPCFEDIRCGF